MSSTVLKEGYFIGLLLRTNKRQRRALLQTITKNQLRVLIEIAYNVLHGYGHIAEKRYALFEKVSVYHSTFGRQRIISSKKKEFVDEVRQHHQ